MNKREPAKRVGTEARLSKWAALMPEQQLGGRAAGSACAPGAPQKKPKR